jgi:hypothetical protein
MIIKAQAPPKKNKVIIVVVNLSYNKIITFLGYYDNSNLPTFHPLQLLFPTILYTPRDDNF